MDIYARRKLKQDNENFKSEAYRKINNSLYKEILTNKVITKDVWTKITKTFVTEKLNSQESKKRHK